MPEPEDAHAWADDHEAYMPEPAEDTSMANTFGERVPSSADISDDVAQSQPQGDQLYRDDDPVDQFEDE